MENQKLSTAKLESYKLGELGGHEQLRNFLLSEEARRLEKRWGQWQLVAARRPRAMSTPPSSSSRRNVKPNPNFPTTAAVKMTNERRHNSISGAPVSPATSPKVSLDRGTDAVIAGLAQRVADLEKRFEAEVGALERRVADLEEENAAAKEQMKAMRDSAEEAAWARKRIEDRIKKQEEEVKKQLEEERKARRESEEKMAVERSGLAKELSEIRKGIAALAETENRHGTVEQRGAGQKVVVFADSNGQHTTAEAIKNHIQTEERKNFDIEVVPAFHVEDAFYMIEKRRIDVSGAIVIVDCLTNDVRGTRQRQPLEPEELVRQIHVLREKTQWANARETVICQVKPMRYVDVTPHNVLLHEYLCGQGVSGCQTMIHMEFLKHDGYHILPQFKSVLDRQYACALLGTPVPCPTPYENFISGYIRQTYNQNWPSLSRRNEGPNSRYGWS